MAVALAVVLQQLRESVTAIWETEGCTEAYPHIRVVLNGDEEQYEVIVEGLVVCLSGNVVVAFALMLASYYVFNLAYPKDLTNTLMFYQRVFLGLTDTQSTRNTQVEG